MTLGPILNYLFATIPDWVATGGCWVWVGMEDVARACGL